MHDLSDDTFKMNDKVAMLVKLSFSCNASAKLVTMQQNEETGKLEDIGASGNKTEIALLKFVRNCGTEDAPIDPIELRTKYVPADDDESAV
jgi:hypothetical protein